MLAAAEHYTQEFSCLFSDCRGCVLVALRYMRRISNINQPLVLDCFQRNYCVLVRSIYTRSAPSSGISIGY